MANRKKKAELFSYGIYHFYYLPEEYVNISGDIQC